MKRTVILFFFILAINPVALYADPYYNCPYSGPDDDTAIVFSVDHYILDLQFIYPADGEDGRVTGIATLNCRTLSDDLSSVSIDLLNVSSIEIQSVLLNGQAADFEFSTNEIIIPCGPYSHGDTFQIRISYQVSGLKHFQYRPKGAERFGFNSMVTNSRWFPCLHDPRTKATYELNLTVPDDKIAASNGSLDAVTDNGDGTVTYSWSEHSPMASYLVTVNIADYVLMEYSYMDMPVLFYVTPEKESDAQTDFEHYADILDFFIEKFGPYPFEKAGLAEVPLSGAMENQDMISFGSDLITGTGENEDTFAHETSHMWWGDSVTLTGCYDVWLNEGFASYCEALWEEHFYGSREYDQVLATFKEKYFQEDSTRRYPIYDPDVVWSATTYKKAAWVLHMLRWVLGDDMFWAVLPDYYDQFKFGNATTGDFQAVCEAHYGQSLDWFFQEWIYDQGYPEFRLSYRITDAHKLEFQVRQVQQNAPAVFKMPVDITWKNSDDSITRKHVWLDAEKNTYSFDIDATPTQISFDPDEKILKKSEWEDWKSTGVTIYMPAETFRPDDICSCDVTVRNCETVTLENYPLFVILDIAGNYYFAPSFSDYDNFMSTFSEFPVGETNVKVLPEFRWPHGAGTFSGASWISALTNPEITALFGDMDTFTFNWEE